YTLRIAAPGFGSLAIESVTMNRGQKIELPPLLLTAVAFGDASHTSLKLNGKTVGSLSGRVVGDGGASMEGVRVNLLGATSPTAAVTDSHGTYRFPDLAAGSYAIQVEHKDFYAEFQSRLLAQPGYDSINQDVSLERCLDARCSAKPRIRHSTRRR